MTSAPVTVWVYLKQAEWKHRVRWQKWQSRKEFCYGIKNFNFLKLHRFDIVYFQISLLTIVLTPICYFTGAVPTPSEKTPPLQTNVILDKKSDSTITVIENPSQMPLEKPSAAKSSETLTPLPALWSSSKEKLISPNLRISKSDSTFCTQASVETLYVSSSFKTFDPVKEIVNNKDSQKSTQPSIVQMDGENLKTLMSWGES